MKFSLVIPVAPERNAEIVESIKKIDYNKKEFHVLVIRGRNPSDNRNRGVEKSRGEIIAFLDDDAVVDSDILRKADNFFLNNPEIDIVGGPQLTPREQKGFAKISGYALSSKFGAWKMANRYSGNKKNLDADETMLTSANMFCKKEVFDKVKFNPLLFPGEDPDFISRAKKNGFKVAYDPEIIVYHKRRESMKDLAKQIYNYGKTRPKKETLLETLKMPFFIVPSLFLIYLVVLVFIAGLNASVTGSVIGSVSMRTFNFLLFFPLMLYGIINFLFSAWNSFSNKNFLALFVLPFVYLLIHLNYGAGFLISTLESIFSSKQKNLNLFFW